MPVGDLVVIFPDQPRALRDQQDAAGRTVIDILGDLRGDLPGEIGPDARDEGSRDHAARLKHVLRRGRDDPSRAFRRSLAAANEKGLSLTRCIEDGIQLLYSDRDFDPFADYLGLCSVMADE